MQCRGPQFDSSVGKIPWRMLSAALFSILGLPWCFRWWRICLQCGRTGLGRSLGGGNVNLLQYSCVDNSVDRGARMVIVPAMAESDMTEQPSTAHQLQTGYIFVLCNSLGVHFSTGTFFPYFFYRVFLSNINFPVIFNLVDNDSTCGKVCLYKALCVCSAALFLIYNPILPTGLNF